MIFRMMFAKSLFPWVDLLEDVKKHKDLDIFIE